MKKGITILSGGLDSAVSTYLSAAYTCIGLALTFDYGQRAAAKEIRAAKHIAHKLNIDHKIIDIGFLFGHNKCALLDRTKPVPHLSQSDLDNDMTNCAKAVWVPNRNGLFINIAACFSEDISADTIITGFNREEAETFPDNSDEFIKCTNRTLCYSTLNKPSVISPTINMDKIAILKTAIDLGIAIDKLWFCYEGLDKWCGICESCARTIRAMINLNVLDKYETLFSQLSN